MSIPGRGKDTLSYHHVTRSAIGIDRQRRADVAWLYTDSNLRYPLAYAEGPAYGKGAQTPLTPSDLHSATTSEPKPRRWKMVTAIGGGPVLIHQGVLRITNDEERMFMGKAREDLHPRTAMGYTRDGQLLMVVVEGRRPGKAEGASLTDLARIMLDLGAVEALNLDGGGSSCLLVMGKETIRPSDKEGQRAVPGVFIIKSRPIR